MEDTGQGTMSDAEINGAECSTNKLLLLNRWCHIIDNIYHCFTS